MKSQKLLFRVACLLLALTLLPVPAFAQAGSREEKSYIVKRRSGQDRAGLQSDLPFEVVEEEELLSLLRTGDVEWYEEDYTVELLDDSPWYSAKMWHLSMTGADLAYGLEKTGQGVRVGVIDSGAAKHPALSQCMAQGWNFVNNSDNTSDSVGHGTAVCGLIAGSGQDGMYGLAPGATVIPLKCFEEKDTKISVICQGIYAGVDQYDCQVLNMSVGVSSESTALREAVSYAIEKGVFIVAAAGNGGSTATYYPAAYDQVIGIGSVDRDGNWYDRSNHNDSVFLTAPGASVNCASRFGGLTTMTGTSFATPQVTGAVAVLKSIDPDLDWQSIQDLLSQTAVDGGAQGWDPYYGYGILNLRGAVQLLEGESSCYILEPQTGDADFTLYNDTGTPQKAKLLTVTQNQAGDRWVDRVENLTLPAYSQVTASRDGKEALALLSDPGLDSTLALRRLISQGTGQHSVVVNADKTVAGENYLLLAIRGTYTVDQDTAVYDALPYDVGPDTIIYADQGTATGSELSFQCNIGKDVPCTFYLTGLFSDSQEPQRRNLGTWNGWAEEEPVPPSALTNCKAAAGNGSVTLSWQVQANGGSPVSVKVAQVGGSTVTLDPSKTSHTLTGLANGTTYSFRISLTYTMPGTGSTIHTTDPITLTATPQGSSGGGGGGSSGGGGGGGGGSSSSSSGTSTKTTNADGSVTETVKASDGTTTITTTCGDGTVVKTVTSAAGVRTSMTVTASQKAAQTGTAALPLTAAAGDSFAVTLPDGASVTFTMKVQTDDPGLVAVVKTADGVETLLQRTAIREGVLSIPLDRSGQVTLRSSGGAFSDVTAADWARPAILFVTARNLFSGTGGGSFSPKADMTRGMLMTVLARLDGEQISGSDWMEKGMAWSKSKGISDGSDPQRPVTRQELVTMLWRNAGSPKPTGDLSGRPDGAQVADWAKEAMAWALENKVMNGDETGKLNPEGGASREQVAQFLMNDIKR